MTNLDPFAGNFQFADFSNFPNSIVDPSVSAPPHRQSSIFPSGAHTYSSPVLSAVSPLTPGFDHPIGKKRKLDNDTSSQQAIDEAARVAAEEDKRRRNT